MMIIKSRKTIVTLKEKLKIDKQFEKITADYKTFFKENL